MGSGHGGLRFARQDRGLWLEACEELGVNERAMNEGLMESHDEVSIALEQAEKIGLLKSGRKGGERG